MTYILNDERRPRAQIVFFAYLNYISRNTYFVPSSFAFLQAKYKSTSTQRNESQSQCARGARWNGKLRSQKMCNTSAPAKYEKLNVSEHHHQHVAAHYETEIHLDSSQIFIFISQPELIDGGWGKVAHKRKLSIDEMNYTEKIESFTRNIRETKESKMKNYPIRTPEIKIQDFKKKRKKQSIFIVSRWRAISIDS